MNNVIETLHIDTPRPERGERRVMRVGFIIREYTCVGVHTDLRESLAPHHVAHWIVADTRTTTQKEA